MKKSLTSLFFAAAISFSAISYAALPPLYQSLNEYKALLKSQELAEKLGSAEGINDIQRTEQGFVITTNRYTLNVDIVHEPLPYPGPSKFHFVFHELEAVK